MMLQEFIEWDKYVRCMCLGQEEVLRVPSTTRSTAATSSTTWTRSCTTRVVKDSLTLVRALGYDMNTVEWAIRDGVPYAIDFMNPAPDMDINSCGYEYHRWCVKNMADMCIRWPRSLAAADCPTGL